MVFRILDWELDGTESYVPPENSDESDFSQNYYQQKPSRNLNLYQLSSITDFNSSKTYLTIFIS